MAQILLIEPDRLLGETYAQALISDGHRVIACAGAQAAILAADQNRPDMVILELQLIKHSGLEFLYEFHSYSEWQPVPVLIQTSVPPGEFAENWQLLKNELGIQAYLYKPTTTLGQLVARVNEYLPLTI